MLSLCIAKSTKGNYIVKFMDFCFGVALHNGLLSDYSLQRLADAILCSQQTQNRYYSCSNLKTNFIPWRKYFEIHPTKRPIVVNMEASDARCAPTTRETDWRGDSRNNSWVQNKRPARCKEIELLGRHLMFEIKQFSPPFLMLIFLFIHLIPSMNLSCCKEQLKKMKPTISYSTWLTCIFNTMGNES